MPAQRGQDLALPAAEVSAAAACDVQEHLDDVIDVFLATVVITKLGIRQLRCLAESTKGQP